MTSNFTIFGLVIVTAFGAVAQTLPERVTFNEHIRPILSDNCFACHGFDKNTREAGLRLDVPEGAATPIEGRVPIVKGKAEESEVMKRILTKDEENIMPPLDTHKKLTTHQIELVRRWIDQGAEYEDHWSFIPMKTPEIPSEWNGREIDYLVNQELARQDIKPSPKAEKWRLVRRLYFDLIGLPPSVAEMEEALKMDHDSLVTKLLSSPHYGEKMAISWLDLVRYADSAGYHGDQPVSVSPYRDYVIQAFNQNMPFDRFTREQIAGDLFPNATLKQKIASGYNRLNMTSEEFGAQDKEYLAKYSGDRVRTTSVVWMGATLGCAECHDHKFDPYTMRDFYSMAAFFADIQEVGVYAGRRRDPSIKVYSPAELAKKKRLKKETSELEEKLAIDSPELTNAQIEWEAGLHQILQRQGISQLVIGDDDLRSISSKVSGKWKTVTKDTGPVYSGESSRKQSVEGLGQHHFKAKNSHVLEKGDRIYSYVWLDESRTPETMMLQLISEKSGGWEHRAFWGADKIIYGGVGQDTPAHRPFGDLPETGKWAYLEVPIHKVGLKPGDRLDGIVFTQFRGTAYWDQFGIARFSESLPDEIDYETIEIVKTEQTQRTPIQAETLRSAYRKFTPLLEEERQRLTTLNQELRTLETNARSMLVTKSVKPRPIRILPRGNWMDESGEIVEPAVPTFLGEMKSDTRLTRMDLANWLASEKNPLTARVFVNRLWKQYFGTGISRVLDDIGFQGEWPTHPELLDWLAVEFVKSGWDVQHLIRVITNSHTYQQSSLPRSELKDTDPYNRMLARQSSFRLDAELIRDAALSVSGLLVRDIGGNSTKPYQPDGYYQHLNFPKRKYQVDRNKNQWRRGIYTHWQRSFLHPMMKSFDAPTREECAADRPRSNTPLQALVLLNDPSYVEAARVFAERIIAEGGSSFEERLNWAFKEALSRTPSSPERTTMRTLFEKHEAYFKEDEAAATEYISVGFSPPKNIASPKEVASWMSLSRVIFNLHEMVGRY